jgi:hypothetical protein
MAKQYAMRLNIYLDENEPKDEILIKFLNKKYSPVGFTKEMLYALATGEAVQSGPSIQANTSEPSLDQEVAADQEFEPVKGVEDIEL